MPKSGAIPSARASADRTDAGRGDATNAAAGVVVHDRATKRAQLKPARGRLNDAPTAVPLALFLLLEPVRRVDDMVF